MLLNCMCFLSCILFPLYKFHLTLAPYNPEMYIDFLYRLWQMCFSTQVCYGFCSVAVVYMCEIYGMFTSICTIVLTNLFFFCGVLICCYGFMPRNYLSYSRARRVLILNCKIASHKFRSSVKRMY
jgi:hypothetical protein